MKTWKQKIRKGMKLIIEGCTEKADWNNCEVCPFAELCNVICMDRDNIYTTPDCYKEQGIFNKRG